MTAISSTASSTSEQDPHGRLKSQVLRFLIAESTILCVLLVNTAVFLATAMHSDVLSKYGSWVEYVDLACVLYFMFEAGLKMWAHGRRRYFESRWNQFDFAIVLASTPVLLASVVDLPTDVMAGVLMLRFTRLLRVFRMLRYVQASEVLKLLRAPIFSLVALALCKSLVLDSPDMLPSPIDKWAKLAYDFLIVQLGFWMLSRLYGTFDGLFLHPRSKGSGATLDGLLLSFVRTLVAIACLLGGFIIGLKNIGQDPWTVLAGIGIGGMAVAFAAQDTIANVISGVFLFIQRPFKIGDRITITGVTGFAESIGLRTMTLRQLTGELVVVPNKQFTGNTLVNIDARTDYRSVISLPIDSQTPSEKIEEALRLMREVIQADPDLEPLHFVNFDTITPDGSFNLTMLISVRKWSPKDQPKFQGELDKFMGVPTRVKTEVVRRFGEAGIRFRRTEALALPMRG